MKAGERRPPEIFSGLERQERALGRLASRLNELFWGLALSLSAVLASAGLQAERPPNIIFIMADDLGYNDLASYGQRSFPTPHTDRLAHEGMRFLDAHSPNAVCSPTRYAVVTGTDR